MMRILLRFAVFCLLTTYLYPAANGQCGAFYDGFESGTYLPTWGAAGGTYTRSVTTTNPATGTYCFEQTGSGTHTQGSLATFTPTTPDNVSYKVKTSLAATTGGYFVIGDANTTSNLGIFFAYFSSNGNFRVYSSGTSFYETPYTANTWYTIELKNIDFNTKTYDIWINNSLAAANFPFRSQATTAVDRIYLYNLSTTVTAWYDEILVGGSPLYITSTGSGVSCPSDSNGTASASVNGGTPTYSYQWSNNDTTASISNLLPGTYYLTVTDSLGCTGTDSAVVTAPSAIVSTSIATDALCHGDSTGGIDLNVSGGTMPYAFNWSNSSNVEDPSGLPAGTYSVVITDSNGCIQWDTAQVGEPSALVLNAVVTDLACNGDSSGAIALTPSGGTPGYTYTWNTSATTQSLSGLVGGTYSVFVSDSNGCSTGDIYSVNEPALLQSSGAVSDDTGTSNGGIDLTVTGGTPPFAYAWSNSATTEDLSGLAAGTYTVVITDSNGCTTSDTFVVSLVIGLDNGLPGPQVDLYPNPGNGLLNLRAGLSGPGLVHLQVTDLRGRVVLDQTSEAISSTWEARLDLGELGAGMYLLSLEANGQKTVRRYIKE